MAAHLAGSAEDTIVIAQIEDIEAVEAIDAIAAVPGIDALFIGRVDLTVAMGAQSQDDPRVVAAVERICQAGNRGGAHGWHVPEPPQRRAGVAREGASLFLLGTDHGFMLAGAAEMLKQTGRV